MTTAVIEKVIMKATLYLYNGFKNTINKTLDNGVEYDVDFKSGTDTFMNINLLLSISNNDIEKYNYAHIDEINKYYFVDNVVMQRNGLFLFKCTEDVLQTFSTEIMQATVIVKRTNQNSIGNDYDNSNNFQKIEYNFNNPFTTTSDVLITARGI